MARNHTISVLAVLKREIIVENYKIVAELEVSLVTRRLDIEEKSPERRLSQIRFLKSARNVD